MFIRTPALQLEVLPEIGGKIAQITDRRSGDRLLVSPRKPYRPLPPDAQWVEFDTSGMDDCFPNVDEGPYPVEPWRGRLLPQLGEWTHGSWTVREAGEAAVSLERTGTVLPYIARKNVDFADPWTIRLRYQVRNTSDHPFRYIWSAHPLIAAGDRFALRLPEGTFSFVTFPDDGCRYTWPDYRGIDLSQGWPASGDTIKVFIPGLPEGWCELALPDRRLRFEFDLARTPVLGVWFNNLGFSGGGDAPFRCIAVEPCTSPSDVLHLLDSSAYPVIGARGEARWWMTIHVE